MAKPPADSRNDDRLDTEAARWHARRDAGWSPAEEKEFAHWLAAGPRHAEVWREFDEAFQPLDALDEARQRRALVDDLASRQRRRRWRVWAGLSTTLAAAAAVAFLIFRPVVNRVPGDDLRAKAGVMVVKPERRTLPDGSVVELNRGAAFEISFSLAQRDVRLLRGEAHFVVAKDAARPFVVAGQGVEVRAVGTSFSVKLDPARVDVLVTEGRVAVAQAVESHPASAKASASVIAEAGSRVVVPVVASASPAMPGPSVAPVPVAEIERLLAWRGPRLELSGTPLAEAVAAFNRENRVQLRVANRALAEMRLSGVFRADNTEGFARMLEANYGVVVERVGDTITLRGEK